MKKILVTGAGGSIGINVLKYLLSEGKYEITALDLNNKNVINRLKKYRTRINVIYGDINDQILMNYLVKDHDVIIHLATVMPPFGELIKESSELVDYKGTETIINAIHKSNNNCFLLYASTTSLYDFSLSASVKEKVKENELSNYSLIKYKVENIIKENVKNYSIFRIPLVLNNIKNESFIFNIKKSSMVEVTTNFDVAYAFVRAIIYQKEINKKTYNVGMGQRGRIQYKDILSNILKYQGLSIKYILSRLFLEKNYYSPVLTDSDNLEEIIHYRHDTLENYFKRLEYNNRRRKIGKLLVKPILLFRKKNRG